MFFRCVVSLHICATYAIRFSISIFNLLYADHVAISDGKRDYVTPSVTPGFGREYEQREAPQHIELAGINGAA